MIFSRPHSRALLLSLLLLGPAASALELLGTKADYRVELAKSKPELLEQLRATLDANAKADPEIKKLPLLRRAKLEKSLLEKVLRAQGYYDAQVDIEMAAAPGKNSNGDLQRVFHVDVGARYVLKDWVFDFPEGVGHPSAETLSLKSGQALVASDVLQARAKLQDWLTRESCLYNPELNYRAVLRREDHSATLNFELRSAGKAQFGEAHFEGLERVSADVLKRSLKFRSGQCYSKALLDQNRLELLQSQLLSSVDYSTEATQIQVKGQSVQSVDVIFHVHERAQRSVKAGINYSTDAGPGMLLAWQHRNFFGHAEQVDIEGGFNDIKRYLNSSFTKPAFLSERQVLTLSTALEHDTPEAYTSSKFESSAVLSRRLGKHTSGELGVAFTRSEVIEDDNRQDFSLVSLPSGLHYDYRDNLLDAHHGWQLGLNVTPFYDLSEDHTNFLRWTVDSSIYLSASDWRMQPTLALRGAAGSIVGASRSLVPADERFYVGGGGSVRGYAYQTLGELTDGKPDGGLAFGETNLELRLQVHENWGLALFVDGGYAYPEKMPSFGENFRWGAGFGLRYLTSFAPIRFDLGIPLNKRAGVDDDFQLYVSIGQAF